MLRLYLYARVRVPMRKLHTGPRVQRAPGLPCALPFWRANEAKLGRDASREREAVSTVIACDKREAFAQGSEATKQSIYPRVELWIASLRSQ